MLFDSKPNKIKDELPEAVVLKTDNQGWLSDQECLALTSILKNLNGQLHFCTKGKWSNHEVLKAIVQIAGPGRLTLSTWTITEDPIRTIVQMKSEGLITELNCILDYRINDRRPESFHLLKSNSNRITLAKCHAKALVFQGEHRVFSMIGSANFTRNPRIEVGLISNDSSLAEFHLKWMNEILENEPE